MILANLLPKISLWSVLLWSVSLALVNLMLRTLRSVSTLGHIPGPWYTHLSNHVLQWHEFCHHRTTWIHALHARYGPVVRISATEVHFNSIEAVRTIYGVRAPVVKDGYYDVFQHGGVENMFSTVSDERHADKKRGIANVYSKASVMKPNTMQKLHSTVDDFVKVLNNANGVELYLVLSYLTLDVVSSFVYGQNAGARALSGNVLNQRRVQEDMVMTRNWSRFWKKGGHSVLEAAVIALHFVLDHVNKLLEVYSAGEETGLAGGVDAYIAAACAAVTMRAEKTEDETVAAKLLTRGMPNRYIISETRDHVIAGSDTTTTVLTYLFHTLATDQDVYLALRQALFALQRDVKGHFDVVALDSCTYLEQVITEALRLFAAIPMTLPRISTEKMTIGGYKIPARTQVGVQCYSLHRDPRIFEDPEVFRPDRWQNPTKEMRDQMWAFSSGSRSCIGKALAMLEMKLVVARVVMEYALQVLKLQDDGMSMQEDTTRFTMVPQDKGMKMKFTSVMPK